MTRFLKPRTLQEALSVLAGDPDACPLSGGQTLVPLLNLGLAQPGTVVSLNGLHELRGTQRLDDGSVRIGALTRHAEVADCPLLVAGQLLLRLAALQIANVAVRTAGTIGGACAHGDPSTNWPVALVTAGATIEVASLEGRRQVAAEQFFRDFLVTALTPGDIVTAILVPPLPGRAAYRKHVRVAGGGAVLSVGVVADVQGSVFRSLRVAAGAVGPRPVRAPAAERELEGAPVQAEPVERFAQALAARAQPNSDVNGSAAYKSKILPRIVARTLLEAAAP